MQTNEIADVVQHVQGWPIPMRIALARQILESVEREPERPAAQNRLLAVHTNRVLTLREASADLDRLTRPADSDSQPLAFDPDDYPLVFDGP
ncbi:MAG TPA: hypothetical protein PK867_07620 [Pirellulales bacterium]|nr:hypothetical protein [Pirellulales bacterium]